MAPARDSDEEKKKLIKYRATCGIIIAAIVITSLWIYAPFPYPEKADVSERLAYALRWLLPVPLLLLWTLHGVGSVRFDSAAKDPLGKKDQDLTILPKNLIQNTIEQGLLHSFGTLMLATYLSPSQLPIIPALAVNFFVGRLLFYWGYRSTDNLKRGYGFAMNLFPTLGLLAFVIYKFGTEMIFA